jgi:hypothetical protein
MGKLGVKADGKILNDEACTGNSVLGELSGKFIPDWWAVLAT